MGLLDTFPQIFVYPAAVLERTDGILLHVAESRFGRSSVPSEPAALRPHLEEVAANSDKLLEELFRQLQRRFDVLDIAAFPGFPSTPMKGSTVGLVPEPYQPQREFLHPWPLRAGEFLLVVGASSHFLLEQPTISRCRGRDWAACAAADLQVGKQPVFRSSVDPKSFFITGASHHCAHRAMHDRRSDKCFLMPFEAFLCCKACVFQNTCWPAVPAPPLPCGEGGDLALKKTAAPAQVDAG